MGGSVEVSALTHSGSMPGLRGPSPLLRLQSDERLIALTRRGQHAAFETLCARYQSRLLSFCRHMLASREDAEDVLQEVFAAAFNAILADEREINVRPWLYRIARNRSLNHLRRATATGVDSMDIHFAEHGLSTSDKVLRRESFRELIGDVHELPETQRTALLLREIDALSYEQIAQAMETTVPSVKSLLVRARISLAEAAEARKLSCERGPPRARRSRRGPGQAEHARAAPRARLRALRVLQEAAQGEQPRAGADHAGRPAAAASRSSCSRSSARPPPPAAPTSPVGAERGRSGSQRHRRRRRHGGRRSDRRRLRRRADDRRRRSARHQGRRRARSRRDRHRGSGRGRPRRRHASPPRGLPRLREHRGARRRPRTGRRPRAGPAGQPGLCDRASRRRERQAPGAGSQDGGGQQARRQAGPP